MNSIRKYITDALTAYTALGTAYFYLFLFIFLFLSGITTKTLHLIIGLVICYIFVAVIRSFYFKHRPIKEKYTNWFTKVNASSFPSLHSITAIFTATVLSTIINNKSVIIFLYIIAIVIAYSRVYIKKHHKIDVIMGIIIGIIFSALYLYLF